MPDQVPATVTHQPPSTAPAPSGRPLTPPPSHSAPTNQPPTPSQPPRTTRPLPPPPNRPAGTPPPTTFTTHLEPEKSSLSKYIMIGIIIILALLLLFQIFSKSGQRSQINNLQKQVDSLTKENAALTQQVAQLQASAQLTQPTTSQTASSPTTPQFAMFYPVLHRERDFQKAAQTIQISQTATINGLYLRGENGKGDNGQVTIYENYDFGKLDQLKPIAKKSFDPSKMPANSPFAVKFDKEVTLKANTPYLLVIETTNKNTEAPMAYTSPRSTAPGDMWVFTRKVDASGKVLNGDFSWQQLPNADLFFELRANL